MDNRLCVLFYIPKLDSGGPDQVFFEILTNVPQDRISPILLTNKKGGRLWDKVQDMNLEAHSLDVAERFPVAKFSRFVKSNRTDVVLCTQDSIMTAAYAKLRYRLDYRTVARPANHVTRSSYELFKKSPLRYGIAWLGTVVSLHLSGLIICQSQSIFDDLRRYRVRKSRMAVIGNPTRVPENVASERIVNRPLRIVSLGRLAYQKGYDILVEAIALLPEPVKSRLRVEIYGEGPEREAIQNLITKYDLGEHISLLGYTNSRDEVLQTADYFVSSSRYEGFPNAVLEALATGLPAIATDCPGGTRELVIPGVTGWLCESGEAKCLSLAIAQAVSGELLDSEVVKRFASDHFSTERIVQQYINALQEATSRG